ncbi:protein NO VEIN-like isoform X2 [Malus sylvestris]|uniref:protein NO VEIN-like isoform X2 n=1 Tax=Malus sylvestris TaxID=3752 RepID=UPI0021AD480E|nr:protein NO VEIN-like isoform X2 [Malus sylvestris]
MRNLKSTTQNSLIVAPTLPHSSYPDGSFDSISNAEDNEYEEGVEPTLEFVMTKKDITGSGAPATLLVFNNEVGFSRKNMVSICSVGRSTKKGKRHQELHDWLA